MCVCLVLLLVIVVCWKYKYNIIDHIAQLVEHQVYLTEVTGFDPVLTRQLAPVFMCASIKMEEQMMKTNLPDMSD